MPTQVNGSSRAGEFLTGSLDYFTILTMVPCFPTQVKAPLNDVLRSLNATTLSASKSITVAGVTYITDATYTDALAKQSNLDTLINVFSTRANPVVVNAYVVSTTTAGTRPYVGYSVDTTFGSAYDAVTQDLYTVKLVGERSGAWYVGAQGNYKQADGVTAITANNTNQDGYLFLTALDGVAITDIAADAVLNVNTFVTTAGANLNTIAVRDEALIRRSDVVAPAP